MTTLTEITKRAKVIYKKHPSKKWTDCIKMASAELKKVSGVKRKKAVSGVKKAKKSPKIKVVTIGKVKKTAAPKRAAVSALSRGRAIVAGINRMEGQYKSEKNKDLKRLIANAINLEHDKLDALTKLKRKLK